MAARNEFVLISAELIYIIFYGFTQNILQLIA